MRREELTVDDGLLCLSINGKSETIFNPTDMGFVEKLYGVFEELDRRQSAMEAAIRSTEPKEVFRLCREADAEMRRLVDSVMGEGTCAAQFGDVNVYAYAEGLPLWSNLLFAVLERCESEVETQLSHPRLEKYRAKYGKK